MPAKTHTAKVVKRLDLTDDLFLLWLEPQSGGKFSFKPGQYCTIGTKGILRPYSIVSAPHEEYIELFVELVPQDFGGKLTPHLHALKVGDSVDLMPRAKGKFTLDMNFKNHVMVSTVTGVVPYVSMVRDYMHRKESGHKFFVLQGASYHDEFGYYNEFSGIVSEKPNEINLVYVPTVSRPNEHRNSIWRGKQGRVNEILEDWLSERVKVRELSPLNTLVYACGHPGMIEDVKARLMPKGWDVKEERFWKE